MDEYPRESVATKANDVADTFEIDFPVVPVAIVPPFMVVFVIVAPLCVGLLTVIVHFAVDAFRISLDELPVKAIVLSLVSTTEQVISGLPPDVVGLAEDARVLAVNDAVDEDPS